MQTKEKQPLSWLTSCFLTRCLPLHSTSKVYYLHLARWCHVGDWTKNSPTFYTIMHWIFTGEMKSCALQLKTKACIRFIVSVQLFAPRRAFIQSVLLLFFFSRKVWKQLQACTLILPITLLIALFFYSLLPPLPSITLLMKWLNHGGNVKACGFSSGHVVVKMKQGQMTFWSLKDSF